MWVSFEICQDFIFSMLNFIWRTLIFTTIYFLFLFFTVLCNISLCRIFFELFVDSTQLILKLFFIQARNIVCTVEFKDSDDVNTEPLKVRIFFISGIKVTYFYKYMYIYFYENLYFQSFCKSMLYGIFNFFQIFFGSSVILQIDQISLYINPV